MYNNLGYEHFLRTFLENCRGRKNSGYHQKFKFKEIEGFLN